MAYGSPSDALATAAREIEATRECVVRDAEAARAEAQEPLDEADPLALSWCPFELAGAMNEPHWTQWLAGLLRLPDIGARTWRALCKVVRQRASETGHVLEEAALAEPLAPQSVYAERPEHVRLQDGKTVVSIPDIVIEDADRFVVLELKLSGDWNFVSESDTQAIRYRRLAEGRTGSRKTALINLAIEARPAEGWVAITWSALARELRKEIDDLRNEQGTIPPRAFPLLALVAGIERTLLELAPGPGGDTSWQTYARARRMLAHFSPTSSGAASMSNFPFDHLAKDFARHYDSLRTAFDEFETQRVTQTSRLFRLAIEEAPAPAEQYTTEGGGMMHSAYWRTRYATRATEPGARERNFGLWLGFCPGNNYISSPDDLASHLVFRGDAWFPLPPRKRDRVLVAARTYGHAGQDFPEERGYFCVPVFRVGALDTTVEQLEALAKGFYARFKQVDEALFAAVEETA